MLEHSAGRRLPPANPCFKRPCLPNQDALDHKPAGQVRPIPVWSDSFVSSLAVEEHLGVEERTAACGRRTAPLVAGTLALPSPSIVAHGAGAAESAVHETAIPRLGRLNWSCCEILCDVDLNFTG